MSVVLRHIRRLLADPGGNVTDELLLERFVRQKDEVAFAALVRRHGPMVLRVCRRVLRHEQDAEDAFQATFLVLARKAASIRQRESVASWLFRVAYHVAVKAKAAARKRSLYERSASAVPSAVCLGDMPLWELRAVLDEELGRLPEKYRAPAVLCYLEGNTQEDAARRLGWTRRAVKSRLARARQLLRTRLARRGLALSGGLLGICLAENALAAALPSALANGTVGGALCFATERAAGGGLASARAVALARGVIWTMALSKAKILAAVLLVVAAVGAGTGVLLFHALADRHPAGVQENAADTKPAPQAGQPDRGEPLTGTLVPELRRWVYSPVEGTVKRIVVHPNQQVAGDQPLILMEDINLQMNILKLQGEIAASQKQINALDQQLKGDGAAQGFDRVRAQAQLSQEKATRDGKSAELAALLKRTNSEPGKPGLFWINSPPFPADAGARKEPPAWTVLNDDFQENLTNRVVKPSDPLLRLGDKGGAWEIDLMVPQKQIGQILQALAADGPRAELDVDLVLSSAPARVFRGKLARNAIAGEAVPQQESKGKDSEPSVRASIRIDGDGIPQDRRIPPSLRLAGTTVQCTIRYGQPGVQGKTPPGPAPGEPPPPETKHKVFVQVPGILEKLHVQNGQRVHKGDMLADFSSRDIDTELLDAETQYQIRVDQLKTIPAQLEGAQDAQEKNKIRLNETILAAERDAYAVRVKALKAKKDLLVLKAPEDGIVMSCPRPEDIGKLWDKGTETPFCTIQGSR